MNPVFALIPIVGTVFGVTGLVAFAALCYPSIREALADRLRHRGLADTAESPAMIAEVRALRGEIYALRSEMAILSRALPAAGSGSSGRLESGG